MLNWRGWRGPDLSDWGQGQMADGCEHGSGPSGCTNAGILLAEKLLASAGRLLDGVKTFKSATSLSPIGACQLIGQ